MSPLCCVTFTRAYLEEELLRAEFAWFLMQTREMQTGTTNYRHAFKKTCKDDAFATPTLGRKMSVATPLPQPRVQNGTVVNENNQGLKVVITSEDNHSKGAHEENFGSLSIDIQFSIDKIVFSFIYYSLTFVVLFPCRFPLIVSTYIKYFNYIYYQILLYELKLKFKNVLLN
jgi:hypothetical protein